MVYREWGTQSNINKGRERQSYIKTESEREREREREKEGGGVLLMLKRMQPMLASGNPRVCWTMELLTSMVGRVPVLLSCAWHCGNFVSFEHLAQSEQDAGLTSLGRRIYHPERIEVSDKADIYFPDLFQCCIAFAKEDSPKKKIAFILEISIDQRKQVWNYWL